ncbi:hypothetical protein [Streptomyces sp. NPDC059224]
MSAAAIEHPFDDGPFSLTAAADETMGRHPGCRVEIVGATSS